MSPSPTADPVTILVRRRSLRSLCSMLAAVAGLAAMSAGTAVALAQGSVAQRGLGCLRGEDGQGGQRGQRQRGDGRYDTTDTQRRQHCFDDLSFGGAYGVSCRARAERAALRRTHSVDSPPAVLTDELWFPRSMATGATDSAGHITG